MNSCYKAKCINCANSKSLKYPSLTKGEMKSMLEVSTFVTQDKPVTAFIQYLYTRKLKMHSFSVSFLQEDLQEVL